MTRRLWTAAAFVAVGLWFYAAGGERLAWFDFGMATALILKWSWVEEDA